MRRPATLASITPAASAVRSATIPEDPVPLVPVSGRLVTGAVVAVGSGVTGAVGLASGVAGIVGLASGVAGSVAVGDGSGVTVEGTCNTIVLVLAHI